MDERDYQQKLESRISQLSERIYEILEIYESGESQAPRRPTRISSRMVVSGIMRASELLGLVEHYNECFPGEGERYSEFREYLIDRLCKA